MFEHISTHFSSSTLRAQNNRIGEASRDDELKIKVIFKEIIDFMYFCRDFKYKRKRITLLLLPLDTHKNKILQRQNNRSIKNWTTVLLDQTAV